MGLSTKNWESSKILICDQCEGKGSIECSELADYHKGEYRYWHVLCKQCNGSGRILKKTVATDTITPYDNPKVADLLFDTLKKDK